MSQQKIYQLFSVKMLKVIQVIFMSNLVKIEQKLYFGLSQQCLVVIQHAKYNFVNYMTICLFIYLYDRTKFIQFNYFNKYKLWFCSLECLKLVLRLIYLQMQDFMTSNLTCTLSRYWTSHSERNSIVLLHLLVLRLYRDAIKVQSLYFQNQVSQLLSREWYRLQR